MIYLYPQWVKKVLRAKGSEIPLRCEVEGRMGKKCAFSPGLASGLLISKAYLLEPA